MEERPIGCEMHHHRAILKTLDRIVLFQTGQAPVSLQGRRVQSYAEFQAKAPIVAILTTLADHLTLVVYRLYDLLVPRIGTRLRRRFRIAKSSLDGH